jgi:alpha-tubulin suppressor-like RCC1 family protein
MGIADATTVAAGDNHACALRHDGNVWCWGHNAEGQLGNTNTNDQLVPSQVGGLGTATAIAAGGDHTCARLVDATAWCWGQNADGELGAPGPDTALPQHALDDAVQIGAGRAHTCALRGDGSVWCWGANTNGQLGDTTLTPRPKPMAVPGLHATSIFIGGDYACALDAGHYRCWGANGDGQLGNGTFDDLSSPAPASAFDAITSLGAGSAHVCGVRGGNVICWGDGDMGELGSGNRDNLAIPFPALSDGHVIAVAGGDDFSCALRDDNSVACWGLGSSGQLGDGTLASWQPQHVALTAPTAVATGTYHSCAITGAAHDVYCWGNDGDGQLGDGGGPPHADPLFTKISNAVQLALGDAHSCALLGDDTVRCWGEGKDGELGNGMFTDDSPPVKVTGLANISAIAAGDHFTCAATPGGAFCWGFDGEGELGDGGGASRASPQLVPNVSPLVPTLVAAGSSHACVAGASTTLCWGAGDSGQLGNGTKPAISGAVTVTNPAPMWTPSRLAAGGDHTCAVDTTGQLRCWGNNDSGEIGDGSSTTRPNPMAIAMTPVTATVTDAVAGDDITCAETTAGPRCWGSNFFGQLGDGTAADRRKPVAVKALATAARPATGTAHACALSTGEVYCWGDNSLGQLGIGTFSVAMKPVEVAFP